MPSTRTNERELGSKLVEWINEYIAGGSFPFTEATNEPGIKVHGTTYFGDIVFWKDRTQNQPFSYLELKPPNAQKEDLERFRKKAIQLKVTHAFTWDFQTLNAYEVQANKIQLIYSEPTPILNKIEEWLRGDKQATIKKYIRRICQELTSLNTTGKLTKFIPDKVYFVNLIRETTEKLLDVFGKFILEKNNNKMYRETIRAYAVQQAIPPTEDKIKILAHHLVYGLVTKIIFYLTVRRFFQDLPELYHGDEGELGFIIRKAFSQAREKDWQAIFEEDPIEQLGIPKNAYPILEELFSELRAYHFGELPEDVIGQLFEEIIDPQKRHELGQYFTREDLVDFVIATVVRDKDGVYCDPTCGSGTFLVRLYDRLRFLSSNRLKHEQRLNQIWGFDIGKFPAELSTINLFRQNISNVDNFPRVRRNDIFEVHKGDSFPFPPPRSGSKAIKVDLPLPEFDALVGNFPYIRQELIQKEVKDNKAKLTKLLAEEYLQTYPALFTFKNKLDSFKVSSKQIEAAVKNKSLELTLSGQADIYAYIFLHAATFLKSDGQFSIITSNAWLDVAYGGILKQFFLDHFKVKMIIASWAEPWFEDAAVNTIITVLERDSEEQNRDDNIVHFVKLKKGFKELVPFDMQFDGDKRWLRYDSIVDTIENAKDDKRCSVVTSDISTLETDEMRIRMVSQAALKKEIAEKKDLSKWGKYLRAPDVYFEILDKCKGKLVPLKEIADVRFGIKTGINEFFYIEKIGETKKGKVLCKNERSWEGEIEEQYLRKIIKSPKEAESITIDPDALKYFIFVCNKSKAELKKDNHVGALRYIEWGEKQKTEDATPWRAVPSVQGRKFWWSLGREQLPEIIHPAGIGEVYKVFDNSIKVLNDKRLYEIYTKGEESLKYMLNSTLFSLFIESTARMSLGDGLVDLTVYEVEENPVLLPSSILEQQRKELAKIYTKFSKRKIKSVFEEVRERDRNRIDSLLLEILGLDVNEYLPRIYKGLCEMVKERLELPKMRKRQQKQTKSIAYDKVKQSVIEDCLLNGVKKFPTEFLDEELKEKDFEKYSTSGKPLIPTHFFGQYEIKDTAGQKICTLDSELKVEYALLLAKPDTYTLLIPKSEKAITIALSKYRKYVRDLQQQLEADANQKAHDWSVAERMAKEILEEFGVEKG
jgi:hypothetical protein